MEDRYLLIYLFILVLLLISIGGYIHRLEMNKSSNYIESSYDFQKSKLTIYIDLDKRQLSLFDRQTEQALKTYPIASGKPSSPSPLGSFRIKEKGKWGEGFGSRWLGLNVPWGIYGIHGTNRPGSIGGEVSAGCIRMQNKHIEELYELVSEDTPVIIAQGLYGPFGNGARTIRPGDRGSDVLEVQKRLKQKGYYENELDGIYGELMKKSLVDFLRDNNLELTDRINEDLYKSLGIILME